MKAWFFACLLLLSAGCVSKPMQEAPTPEEIVVVEEGDVIVIDYIGRTSDTGELVSTSYESVALDPKEKKAEGFVEGSYGPINLTIGSGVIPSIEKAGIGMRAGNEREVLISASEAYGERLTELVRTVMRVAILPIITEVPLERFQTVPKEGAKVDLRYWEAQVIEVTNDSVALRHMPTNGSNVITPYGPAIVTLNETHVLTTLNPELGAFVVTPLGRAKIINFDAATVTLDHNHPLAGKNLVYQIKIKEIIKPGR